MPISSISALGSKFLINFAIVNLDLLPFVLMICHELGVILMKLVNIMVLNGLKMDRKRYVKTMIDHFTPFGGSRYADVGLLNAINFNKIFTAFHKALHIILWVLEPKIYLMYHK